MPIFIIVAMKQYTAVWEKQKLLADLAKNKKWSRVLDFGCGNGAYAGELLKYAEMVYCLDNDQNRIKELKTRFAREKKVKAVYGNSQKLPFKDKYFDLVWASEVLEHQTNLALVKEWERVSKNLVIITVPNPRGPYWYRDKTHILNYHLSGLKSYFRSRPDFSYQISGLGFCWPAKFGMISLRKIFLKLCRKRPYLAWTWLVLGKRKKT